LEAKVFVQSVTEEEQSFGNTAKHILVTEDGCALNWNASKNSTWLTSGDVCFVRMTIKNHFLDLDGVRTTRVSSVKEIEEKKRVPRVTIGGKFRKR